ncbi:MAG TPA: hypothetical protein VF131_12345 [Blastocatellia bacterium]|nr:hypothetical protein [Blastocatellia bacterium]
MNVQSVALRLKAISAISFNSRVALVGIMLAVLGPFLLVMLSFDRGEINSLPWYIWISMPLLLITVIVAGFLMFKRKSVDPDEISISPKNR